MNNQLGGIIQALMVFKNTSNIYQITGDPRAQLGGQHLERHDGDAAPNSVRATPKGLAFMAPDGMRLIDFTGNVIEPIGFQGQGVTIPFIYTAQPTRVCAACNGGLMRISTQNGNIPSQPQEDRRYDFSRNCWTGRSYLPGWACRPLSADFHYRSDQRLHIHCGNRTLFSTAASLLSRTGPRCSGQRRPPWLRSTDYLTNSCITESSVDMGLPPNNASVGLRAPRPGRRQRPTRA